MKLKKIFLLGMLIPVTIVPVASIVSCGPNKNETASLWALEERERIGNYKFSIPTNNKVRIAMVASGPNAQKNDNAFNQSIYNAIQTYYTSQKISGPVSFIKPTSSKPSDIRAAYETAFQNAEIVLGAGNEHQTALEGNNWRPPVGKALIIDGIDVKKEFVASLLFRIYEPAFMAGVASSMYLNKHQDIFAKDGNLKAGAYGGQDVAMIPHFISGFQQGVKYFNENVKKDGDKEVKWIDLGSRNDYFSGSWNPGGGTAISNRLIDAGADVILPAAGQQALDTLKVITQRKSSALIVGVDSKMEDSPNYKINGQNKHIIFSIIQDATRSIVDIVDAIKNNRSTGINGIWGLGGLSIGGAGNKLATLSNTQNSLVSKTNALDIYAELNKTSTIQASSTNSLKWDI